MALTIKIAVDKPGTPPGHVLIEDAGSLANGLHGALARLIQRQLGFPGRTKLRDEAKQLTAVSLTGVSQGSGVLECNLLPVGVEGRHPAAVVSNYLTRLMLLLLEPNQNPLPVDSRERPSG